MMPADLDTKALPDVAPSDEFDALASVWHRLLLRLETQLKPAELVAKQLLDGHVDRDVRDEAYRCLDEASVWLADLNMVAAARGARALREHVGEIEDLAGRDVGRAVITAGLIEGVRASVETVGASGMATGSLGDELLVIGEPSVMLDNIIWFAAASGFTVHHRSGLEHWPKHLDTRLVVDRSDTALSTTLLMCRSAKESDGETPLIVVTDRTSTRERADIAQYADSLLSMRSRTADIIDEARRRLHSSKRLRPLAVRGSDAQDCLAKLTDRGVDAWSADNDSELLAGLESGRASGVLFLPADDNDAMIRLLRSQPSTRNLTIVEVLEEGREEAASAGVDATIESLAVIGERAGQLDELLRQRSDLDTEVSGLVRVAGVPWASATFLAERAILAAHRTDSVVSVCAIRYGPGEETSSIDAVQEALLREFRTDDIVTRSADDENILVLSGVGGAVTQARFLGIVERASTPGSRVGIAEFPHDAQSLTELVAAAREAIDRADAADAGPRVATADWQADRRRAADVIIADSDLAAARIVTRSLERIGTSVEHISDGQVLLERLRDQTIESPKMLILEFDLLSVDGLTILRRLNDRAALRRFDVVMLSSRTRESDVRQAYDLGVIDVIEKPFSPAILVRRLTRLLKAKP